MEAVGNVISCHFSLFFEIRDGVGIQVLPIS